MRSVGGVLLAVGAIVLLSRKSGHDHWGRFAQLLVLLIPAALLYALALARAPRRGPPAPEQTVLAVTAILLSPFVLLEFLRWVRVSTTSALTLAAVFAVTALLAAYSAGRARITYAALLAGISALAAWLLVWSKILDHPSAGAFRWLLVAGALVLFCVAAGLAFGGVTGAREVATAGGIAAVGAGVIGVVVSSLLGAVRAITTAAGGLHEAPQPLPFVRHLSGAQRPGWDVYLLVLSLALVWVGSRVRSRGLGYAGAAGLLVFLLSVVAQLTRLQSGHARTHDVVGWPLALLLIGAAGVAAGSRGVLARRNG